MHHTYCRDQAQLRTTISLSFFLFVMLVTVGCGGFRLPSSTAESVSVDLLPTTPEISERDLTQHVAALTDPRTNGRRSGSPGERVAADYLSRAFSAAGLAPASERGDWFDAFEFTSGVSLGRENRLTLGEEELKLGSDWRPLAFSRSGSFAAASAVFVGYGLMTPADGERPAIDEYGDVDVQDRWVIVLRDLPQIFDDDTRRSLRRYAGLRFKAMIARDRGARGVLFVSGPRGRFKDELAPLRFDASLAGTSIAAISISNDFAQRLLSPSSQNERTLDTIQGEVDEALLHSGDPEPRVTPIELDQVVIEAHVELLTKRAEGINVLGRLQVGPSPSAEWIVIGAHYDHLGRGESSGSLADAEEANAIHSGADDNASGTALVVELAEAMAARHQAGVDLGKRDFLFAAWSGEELGLLGSDAWVAKNVNPHGGPEGPVAYLNFDMVGRLRDSLVIQGVGSSPAWATLLEELAAESSITVQPQNDSYVPTDATSFYKAGVPILSAFTGAHSEYHTPRDTLETLNLADTEKIGELFLRIAESIGRAETPPPYLAQAAPAAGNTRGGFRVFLGTIPDYARTDVVGVLLSGVAAAGPAETAGLKRGDLIIGAAGKKIENLYDYTYALEAMRVGEPTQIRFERDGKQIEIEVVPSSRD